MIEARDGGERVNHLLSYADKVKIDKAIEKRSLELYESRMYAGGTKL
jgi:hypothetical protein